MTFKSIREDKQRRAMPKGTRAIDLQVPKEGTWHHVKTFEIDSPKKLLFLVIDPETRPASRPAGREYTFIIFLIGVPV